jgi:c-di-GMP-binding flagellar brake protein YcgR
LNDERRRYQRVAAPVLYRFPRHSTPKRPVKNISLGGVRVSSDEDFDIGRTLDLELFLPNGMTIEAVAKVVWVKKQLPGSEGLYDVGLEFIDLSETARMELDFILNQG